MFFRPVAALSLYPLGLKEDAPLAMYPLVVFPYTCTLWVDFSLEHLFYAGSGAGSGGVRRNAPGSGALVALPFGRFGQILGLAHIPFETGNFSF